MYCGPAHFVQLLSAHVFLTLPVQPVATVLAFQLKQKKLSQHLSAMSYYYFGPQACAGLPNRTAEAPVRLKVQDQGSSEKLPGTGAGKLK